MDKELMEYIQNKYDIILDYDDIDSITNLMQIIRSKNG